MSLSDVKAWARSIVAGADKLAEAAEELSNETLLTCVEDGCSTPIKADGEAYCTDCGAPPDCDGCAGELLSGFCATCANEQRKAVRLEALGLYPEIGIKRTGPYQDQILVFLTTLFETCCGARQNKLCPRCSDAVYLRTLYDTHLGEIRA